MIEPACKLSLKAKDSIGWHTTSDVAFPLKDDNDDADRKLESMHYFLKFIFIIFSRAFAFSMIKSTFRIECPGLHIHCSKNCLGDILRNLISICAINK